MAEKSSSKLWLIPLIIGICIAIGGIVMIICGALTYVPSMGEEGWFDAETTHNFLIFIGIFILLFGIMFGGGVSYAIYSSKPEVRAKRMKMLEERKQIFTEMLSRFGVSTPKQQEKKSRKVCSYCDTEVDDNEKICPSCGAKKFIKK